MAVASLWPVPSAATALLMFRFYERWRVRGDEPATALCDAQRWLRDTTNGEKISYFEDIALDDRHPMAGAAQEPYELLFRAAAEPARPRLRKSLPLGRIHVHGSMTKEAGYGL